MWKIEYGEKNCLMRHIELTFLANLLKCFKWGWKLRHGNQERLPKTKQNKKKQENFVINWGNKSRIIRHSLDISKSKETKETYLWAYINGSQFGEWEASKSQIFLRATEDTMWKAMIASVLKGTHHVEKECGFHV